MSFSQFVLLYCLIGVGWSWRYDYYYKRDPTLRDTDVPFWFQLVVVVIIWPVLFVAWIFGPHKNKS